MVTTNQKPTVDSENPKRREHKYNTTEKHQTTKGKPKRKSMGQRKNVKINEKTRFKMLTNTYQPIITLMSMD